MNQRKKRLLRVFCAICAAGAAVCGWGFYREWKPRIEAENFYQEMRSLAFSTAWQSDDRSGESGVPERGKPDWDALRAWNPDICGWIYCPGTDIDYPVVQGADNDWYLNRTVDNKKSIVGSIFLESANSVDFQDDVSVIYGHHIRGGRMFTPISGYKEQAYYEEHPEMYLYTPKGDYRVELFAGEILSGSTGRFPLQFRDEAERREWLEKITAGGAFLGAVPPVAEERILALCTCTYEYQDARYTVYGILKKLEIDEDEERRTQDEKNSENHSAGAEPSDDVSRTGDHGVG